MLVHSALGSQSLVLGFSHSSTSAEKKNCNQQCNNEICNRSRVFHCVHLPLLSDLFKMRRTHFFIANEGSGMAWWLGRWTCYPKVQGPSPAFTTWICFRAAQFRNPTTRFLNSQLACLPPFGTFNKCYVQFVYLFH